MNLSRNKAFLYLSNAIDETNEPLFNNNKKKYVKHTIQMYFVENHVMDEQSVVTLASQNALQTRFYFILVFFCFLL